MSSDHHDQDASPHSPDPDATIRDSRGDAARADNLPESIGHYRILRRIGAGGMGVVYEAQQENPKRTVALKVINPGVATPAMLRRFEHEAHILGQLQHPGIAQIFEAGTFDGPAGPQPYFAMELVNGRPLNEYAEARQLSVRQRLELIVRICRAVQHAHQKGVIHRDLKPGNILVVDEDEESAVGEMVGRASPPASTPAGRSSPPASGTTISSIGHPKILDFGVARATDSDLQTTTLQTDIGQLIGTVPYMSPEQAGGDPAELDFRSDVYALGVIAYELLAGCLPYDLHNRLIHEAVRIIREEEPTRLSHISRTLKGDIEIMVGKALAKEKDRRYQSALDFASDIERYLQDQPIIARPPSAAYQFKKFTRRNKVLVGGIAATFIVLIAGLAGTTYGLMQAVRAAEREAVQRLAAEENELLAIEEARRAEREAERALAAEAEAKERADELELVSEFQASQLADIDVALMGVGIRRNILDKRRAGLQTVGKGDEEVEHALADLERSLAGVNFTNVALETLDENIFERALMAIDEKFADQPLLSARLLQTLAETMVSLGLVRRALEPQAQALKSYESILGDDHPITLGSFSNMAHVLGALGMREEAERHLVKALDGRKRIRGDDHPETLLSMNNMAVFLENGGRYAEAELYYRKAIEGRRRTLGEEHPDTLVSRNNLAFFLQSQGNLAEAGTHFREILEHRRRLFGNDHPDTLLSTNNLANVLQLQGQLDEAESLFRVAIEGARQVLGDHHATTLRVVNNFGQLLALQGRFDEAEPYVREALDTARRVWGDAHRDTLTVLNNMGHLLAEQGRPADAEPYYREALKLRRQILGNDHPDTLGGLSNMGALLRELGRLDEAEQLAKEAVERARRVLPESHWHTGVFLLQYGATLKELNRFSEAAQKASEAQQVFEVALGDAHGWTRSAMGFLGDLYADWHVAEPDAGHDVKAAEWRGRLAAANENAEPSSVTPESASESPPQSAAEQPEGR